MSSNILELVYDAIMERRRPRPLVIILSVIGAIAAAALGLVVALVVLITVNLRQSRQDRAAA